MTASTLIPVHVLTGFLGSGKTTLLNHALQAGFGPETAVIVNEFGDVGLDQHFIQARSEETIVLKSGCVCCTIRTDLVSTLLQIAALRTGTSEPFRRILIETSGISDPLPILQTLRSDFNLLTRFRAGSVVCAVDVSDLQPAHGRAEGLAQITAADAIVLTKRDLVDGDTAHAMQSAAVALNPLAEIVAGHGQALVNWLERQETRDSNPDRALENFPVQLVNPLRSFPRKRESGFECVRLAATPRLGPRLRGDERETEAHGVRTIVIRAAAPPSWPCFAVWLTRLIFLHGDRILRTKGVLFDAEREVWIGVHGVRRFFHPPVHLALQSPPSCGACLVFITEGLDPARIEASYRRMVEQQESMIIAEVA